MNAIEAACHVDILPETVKEVPNPRRGWWELWKPETAHVATDFAGNGWLLVENVTTFEFPRGANPEMVLEAKVQAALERAKGQFPQGNLAVTPGVVTDIIAHTFAPNRRRDKAGVPIFETTPSINPRFPGRSIWVRFENTTVRK